MAEHQAWLQHSSLPAPDPGDDTAWVRQAGVSDTAVALYAVLLQCSDRGDGRMPTTETWAARLPLTGGGGGGGGGAGYAVGMAIAELVGCGAVRIGHQPATGHRHHPRLVVRLVATPPRRPDPAGVWILRTRTLLAACGTENWVGFVARVRADGGADGLAAVEADLDACDGLRPILQQRARDQLTAEGVPLTREAVLYRAHTLLRQRGPGENPGHGPSGGPMQGAGSTRGPGGGW